MNRSLPKLFGLILALAFAGLVTFVQAAQAADVQVYEGENLRIKLDPWLGSGSTGYVPVELDVENLGADRILSITGVGETARYSYSGAAREEAVNISQTLSLRSRDRVHVTLAIPFVGAGQRISLRVMERGRVLRTFNLSFQQGFATTLVIAGGSGPMAEVTKESASRVRRTSPQIPQLRGHEQLPVSWLGYTTVGLVYIETPEWGKMSDAQKEALLTWTAAGGTVVLADGKIETLLPDPKKRPTGMTLEANLETRPDAKAQRYFFGQILLASTDDVVERLKWDGREQAGAYPGMPGYPGGYIPPTAATTTTGPPPDPPKPPKFDPFAGPNKPETVAGRPWLLPINNNNNGGAQVYYDDYPGNGNQNRGFRLPIPGVTGIHARAYLGILVVFTLLIGPGTYLFLNWKKRLVLMVLTTPLISAAFLTLLAGYAFFGEGFGVRARAETLTFLDQKTKQATTRATVTMYAAGMAPRNGLRYSRDTAIFPIGSNSSSTTLDLTEAQHYTSGRIQARTPANSEQILVRTARERLTFTNEGGRVTVLNGLGGTVSQLYYRSGTQVYSVTAPIPDGGRAELKPVTGGTSPAQAPSGHVGEFKHFFSQSMTDDGFFAVMDRSPFWEPGVSGIDERGSLHMITGYAGGEL